MPLGRHFNSSGNINVSLSIRPRAAGLPDGYARIALDRRIIMVATPFTPNASLLGGALIGLSAVLLMWATGRIAGVSGIAARLFPPYEDREFAGRLAFVAGLVAAPVLARLATGSLPAQTIAAGTGTLVAAGLLVGFGSVWGSGCTSG